MEQDILDYAEQMQCQELHMFVNEETKLKGIIAIHNTVLGPALGGCRLIEYPNTAAAAIDAIRLAQGMTYKAALADLPLGGGKMVILKPKVIEDRNAFFDFVGQCVESLRGRYITSVDSGTSVEDMDIIAKETKHVIGTSKSTFKYADPSHLTALGVMRGIEAAVQFKFGKDSLKDIHVAIQGLGHAGYHLAQCLYQAGAKLSVFDINKKAVEKCVKEFKATPVESLDDLLAINCDVFSPCALGGVLNDLSIETLKAPIVAGCANNQLQDPRHGEALLKHGILYAPDYVINSGGLIYVAAQISNLSEETARERINDISKTLMEIFHRADKEKRPTSDIADTIALERIKTNGANGENGEKIANGERI